MTKTSTMQLSADQMSKEIRKAEQNGTRLFLCGLIHNYSIKSPGGEKDYVCIRGGKRILSTSEILHLIRPNVVLIE